MITHIKNALRRFSRSTDGSTSVEAVIVYPALAVIFAASWVYFDVMRQQSISIKANYTIGDIISRETEMLDDAYISNARELLFHLTKGQGEDVDLRVTVVQYNASGNELDVIWSEARGDWSVLSNGDLSIYAERIPQMADADQLILVETRDAYEPTFNVAGIGPFDIETYSFTRPRFASQVIFEGVNDGSNFNGSEGPEETPETPS
ncbi:TadE/TadG family type IV pilus assembly protein [Marivita sp. S0852]|uniref:TadE/TadG family type IV pilus assembly protein n=1 Tax=Marivita sp. S0852 TaxID=3373893 RepID=UPI00398244F0